MEITPETKLKALLSAYPYLKDFLVGYHADFKQLDNPAVRATVGAVATLEAVAGMASLDPTVLVADIAAEVARHDPSPDRDASRREQLKQIVRDLHAGVPVPDLKARFAALADEVGGGEEIAALEQELIDGGMPAEEVKRLCDVHVEVFKDALEPPALPELPAGHPVATFIAENAEARRATAALRAAAVALPGDPSALTAVGERLAELAQVEKHYLRKENQLFPFLESHDFTGPSSVMWAIHDDVRSLFKMLRQAVADGDVASVAENVEDLATAVDEMTFKEERILFPTSLEMLSDEEWEQVRAGEPAIGYSWVPEPPAWPGPAGAAEQPADAAEPPADVVPLRTGALSPEQVDLLFGSLPLDVSFVDEEDRVRFYSEGERIFPRSPAVIGRKVQACHPPASLGKVQAILDAFRAGERSEAEFWIEMRGRFVHIRYFALRDSTGAYRGCLEVTQDVTGIRALAGERRLLDWT